MFDFFNFKIRQKLIILRLEGKELLKRHVGARGNPMFMTTLDRRNVNTYSNSMFSTNRKLN